MTTKTKSNGTAKSATKKVTTVPAIRRKRIGFRIVGTSPLVQHKWSEKSLKQLRDKHAGIKTKNREVRDPQKEGEEAAYRTADGQYGILANSLKCAIIDAAHNDLGIPKTLVKKAVFVLCNDRNNCLPMDCDEPIIQEDHVRVGTGTDLRYRPYFYKWGVDVEIEIDEELMSVEALLRLVDRAGFGVGIGEMRPEKGKEFGRFTIDTNSPVTEV
jgi:hypothetical protein